MYEEFDDKNHDGDIQYIRHLHMSSNHKIVYSPEEVTETTDEAVHICGQSSGAGSEDCTGSPSVSPAPPRTGTIRRRTTSMRPVRSSSPRTRNMSNPAEVTATTSDVEEIDNKDVANDGFADAVKTLHKKYEQMLLLM